MSRRFSELFRCHVVSTIVPYLDSRVLVVGTHKFLSQHCLASSGSRA